MQYPYENQNQKLNKSKSIEVMRINNNLCFENEKESKYSDIDVSKSKIFETLKKVFLTNASFNKSTKEYYITRFQIILILKQSYILNENIISQTQVDILFSKFKSKRNKFSFLDFMDYLNEVCKYIFKKNYDKDPKKYFNNFLNYLLNNYYDTFKKKLQSNYVEKTIDNNCTLNGLKKLIESNIDRHALKLLFSIYDQLKKLYICYFPNEKIKKDDEDFLILNSMENLIIFGKDFEIIPKIIKEKDFVTYYNLLLKHQKDYSETINDIFHSIYLKNNQTFQDVGHCFKLSTFILFLYHLSLLLYYKKYKASFSMYQTNRPEDVELIMFLLQKFEHSEGLSKYILKRHRTKERKFTFIPTNQDIENVLKDLSDDKYGGKPLFTTINEHILAKTIFNDDKELTTIDKNSTINNNLYNSYAYFDLNQSSKRSYRNKSFNETSKNNNKREEMCKFNKNINDIINKQIIKNLNTTSSTNILRKRKKEHSSMNSTDFQLKNGSIPILNLENFLNVSSEVIKIISNKLDNLEEMFLKFSKMNDKIGYNRMSFSAFLQFLKSSNILIVVPENKKNSFTKMRDKLVKKNMNVSQNKIYDKKNKISIPLPMVFTEEEKKYKLNVSQFVSSNRKEFSEKINVGEAWSIFHFLTNLKNFPVYDQILKTQFDKNTGFDVNVGDNLYKTISFNEKALSDNQLNAPGKMNFMLFIKSFELIATELFPEETLNSAVFLLLNKKIFPILPKENIINSKEVVEARNKLQDKDIQYFLNELSPIIKPLYIEYSDNDCIMSFSNFLDFYTQFDLFPELISLSKMKTIFLALNELSNNNYNTINSENKNNQIQIERLNFNLFLTALGITAMLFNYKDIVSDLDRLLYICFRIYNAKPIQKKTLEGPADVQINKKLHYFMRNFKKKFEKNKEKNKNEKEKMNLTVKETVELLDFHFNFKEEHKNKEKIVNKYL